MQARYEARQTLASLAARMARRTGHDFPALFLFTDPERLPDPLSAARALPPGCGIIYRHFGKPDRADEAAALAQIAHTHGLTLLIAADPALALSVGAAGVHWPQWALGQARRTLMSRFAVNSAAAHSPLALARAENAGMDLAFVSPVFATRSASGGRPLGPYRAAKLAAQTQMPLYALGGIQTQGAKRLINSGLSGMAAVQALA